MKKQRMTISTVFATIFLMLSFAGCGKLLADGSQATTITSTQTQNASLQPSVEQMPTSPPKPTATTIPSPATMPTFTTQLTQLQTKEGYIPPKSLENIDPIRDLSHDIYASMIDAYERISMVYREQEYKFVTVI